MKWTVLLTKETDPDPQFADIYNAECVELPGCLSYGNGLNQATERIKEAIQCYLEGLINDNEPIPANMVMVDVSQLEDPPDYIISVDVPIPNKVAA